MHHAKFESSCPGTATLNEHEDDEKFNYCQWDTTDRAIWAAFTATYKEYKETLLMLLML